MNCLHCNTKLIWGGDHTYEDYFMDGDGIVTNLSCPNDECEVELVLVYNKINQEQMVVQENQNSTYCSNAKIIKGEITK